MNNIKQNRKRNSLLMLGVILAVLAVAGMAMVGAVSADDPSGTAISDADSLKNFLKSDTTAEGYLDGPDVYEISSKLSVCGTKVLNLNGRVIKQTSSDSVFEVGNSTQGYNGNLTITDTTETEHYFTMADSSTPMKAGLWKFNESKPSGTEGVDYVVLKGGCITGASNEGKDCAGVSIKTSNSEFTLKGGNIVGNNGKSSGGVLVEGGSAIFTMEGGCILGNNAHGSGGGGGNGAGVKFKFGTQTFNMYGGIISYNLGLGNGPGVYIEDDHMTVNVKGKITITDNQRTDGSTENVYFKHQDGEVLIDITGILDEESNIGVSAGGSSDPPIDVAHIPKEDYVKNFTSDKSTLYITYQDICVRLANSNGSTVKINSCTGISDYYYRINGATAWTKYNGSFMVENGKDVELKAVDTDGYLFEKWADGVTDNPLTITVSSNVEYSPTATTAYAVTLDKNGGNADGKVKVSKGNKKLTITTAPTMTGYAVEGYYTDSACSKNVAGADGALVASVSGYTDENGEWIKESDTTLYPKWVEVPTLTITFNNNGGSGTMEAKSVEQGKSITLPKNTFTAPTTSKYMFRGWNTAADGSGTYYDDEETITPTGDMTLYAQWFDYSGFDVDGGTWTYSVSKGTVTLTLTKNMDNESGNPGPVTVAENSRKVVINLDKYHIVGKNGVDGDSAGKAGVVIVNEKVV